jgi:hypothetical protein
MPTLESSEGAEWDVEFEGQTYRSKESESKRLQVSRTFCSASEADSVDARPSSSTMRPPSHGFHDRAEYLRSSPTYSSGRAMWRPSPRYSNTLPKSRYRTLLERCPQLPRFLTGASAPSSPQSTARDPSATPFVLRDPGSGTTVDSIPAPPVATTCVVGADLFANTVRKVPGARTKEKLSCASISTRSLIRQLMHSYMMLSLRNAVVT